MAVKQERNGTTRLQSRNTLDADSMNFMNNTKDPDVIKWLEQKARTSALILHRWLRPKLAKKFTIEEHAKFFYTEPLKPAAKPGGEGNAVRSDPGRSSPIPDQLQTARKKSSFTLPELYTRRREVGSSYWTQGVHAIWSKDRSSLKKSIP